MKYKYSTPVLFEICDIGDFHEQEVEFQQSSLGFEIEYVQAHGWVWLADRTDRGFIEQGEEAPSRFGGGGVFCSNFGI
jgi:hypothetical protein